MAALARHRTGSAALQRRWLAAVLVFSLVLAGLAWKRAGSDEPSIAGDGAERAALQDPDVRAHLQRHGYDRVRVLPLDGRTVRVSFFEGRRVVLEAAVSPDGRVRNAIRYDERFVRLGSEVGQRPAVLFALVAMFVLATLRLPLRSRANFDAVALAGVVVPVVLMNERFLEWSVLAGVVLLAYLALRCAAVALGPATQPGGEWLLDRLPRHIARLCVGAAAGALALLSIPGGIVSDVAFASLAGATEVLHGVLPYGNLPQEELVHGDTYPLFAYLAYVPAALAAPVNDAFDSLDSALWITTGFALVAAAALARAAGSRVALAFLAFPPVMIAASAGSNDVVAAGFVALALAVPVHGGRSTAALAAAGWVKLAPLALLPLWVARYRSRAAVWAAAGITALVGLAVLALGGPSGFADMLDALSFQAERGSLLSPWTLLGAGGAQIVFQAAVAAGIALACMRVWRDRELAADPRRMAALGAAILLGVQLAASYWSYTYLAWVFPLVAVALLTPSRPPEPSV
jgi:hypothetical protein